jgi:hypothetical protein
MSSLRASRFAMAMTAVLVGACATTSGIEKSMDDTLHLFETAVRWSEWDGAVNFIAPEYLAEHPISQLDLDRLRLFRVTSYTVRSTQVYDEGMTVSQGVEIRLFHKSQAVERAINYNELWRYDKETERWWLHSDLPDPTQGR